MIYFVQAGVRGPVKIGKAKDVVARIAILATGHYEPLSVLATLDVADAIEGKLHRLLKPYRLRGEWFAWCPEVERVVDLARDGALPAFPKPKSPKQPRRGKKARNLAMPDAPEGSMVWWVASVRRQIEGLGLSQRRIGKAAGIDPKTVGNFLNGADPAPRVFDALLDALPELEKQAADSGNSGDEAA